MLIFVSDIHLSDGSSGETIHPGAFKKFGIYAKDMAETAGAKQVEVVFLGDIFDVIRSERWLATDIRPWSPPDFQDGNEHNQEYHVLAIVNAILAEEKNRLALQHLADFRKAMESKGIPVTFTYIVGNHDWLINRYQSARDAVANALGLHVPAPPFLTEKMWQAYGVFARHGDIHDPYNFEGDRDASSLGDAIVVDLLNRFPSTVEASIGVASDPSFMKELREIDNVRPLVDIPQWIEGACRKAKSKANAEVAKREWNRLVDDFLRIPFVQQHEKFWWPDRLDRLEAGLRLSKHISLGVLSKAPLRLFQPSGHEYQDGAFREESLRANEVQSVVYGHTHEYLIQPLDIVAATTGPIQKKYFNTGTWRKVHVRAAHDPSREEFMSWHVMTFVAFYLTAERPDTSYEKRNITFEVWNGALG